MVEIRPHPWVGHSHMVGLLQLQRFSSKSEGSEPQIRAPYQGSALGRGAQRTFVFEGQLGLLFNRAKGL